MALEAQFEDILREKGHRYRRVLIPICLIILAIYWLEGLNFSALTFFGLTLDGGAEETRSNVLIVLFVLMAWHASLLVYHAREDWKDWCFKALSAAENKSSFRRFRCTSADRQALP